VTTLTRDDPRYWDDKPDDHNDVGLFDIGPWEKTGIPACPQEKRPSLYFDIKTGEANRAPEVESREAIFAREEELRLSRLRRMGIATTGARTGRNRNKRKAA
jgi:hypothetical protein